MKTFDITPDSMLAKNAEQAVRAVVDSSPWGAYTLIAVIGEKGADGERFQCVMEGRGNVQAGEWLRKFCAAQQWGSKQNG